MNKMDGMIASKLATVNEDITIRRADNGWIVEVGGRSKDDDWKNYKLICNELSEVIALITEHSAMKLQD